MNLSGAFGIAPKPTPAMIAHPERVARWATVTLTLWIVRLSAVAGGLGLLFLTHLLEL